MKTEQEEFWAGDFGNEYIIRNDDIDMVASNIAFFARVFRNMDKVESLIEFGSNIGNNLLAIRSLLPKASLSCVEINSEAVKVLKSREDFTVYHESILDFFIDLTFDLVFIKGVLIHINPEELKNVYKKLYNASKKYILLAEYYNPAPVALSYRGHDNKLFKRDFAGEILELYPDLKLLDYGFTYSGDKRYTGLDDITWFLLEKK